MYKMSKVTLVIIMVLSILLMFGCNYSIFANSDLNYATLDINKESNVNVEQEGRTSTVEYNGLKEKNLTKTEISFVPKQTGVYKIIVEGIPEGSKEYEEIKYLFKKGKMVMPLAATNYAGGIDLITPNDPKSTSIDVYLTENEEYSISFPDHFLPEAFYENMEDLKITVKKTNMNNSGVVQTNVPSYVASEKYNEKTNYKVFKGDEEVYEFEKDEIQDYSDFGKEDDEVAEQGGKLEGLIVDIILAIGSVIMFLTEKILGSKVPVTMDNIIFNKFSQVIIDLTPLGGINVGSFVSGTEYSAFKILAPTIKLLFDGLKGLAVIIYIIMLLYIGVKILMNIGGSEQGKTLKYLEYWFTGLIILTFLPYFLPAIPAMSNALVALMEDYSKKYSSEYTQAEVLELLGYDAAYLGEDAETVNLLELIDQKIENLNHARYNDFNEITPPKKSSLVGNKELSGDESESGDLSNSETKLDIKQKDWQNKLWEKINNLLYDLEPSARADAQNNFSNIINYVEDNMKDWKNSDERKYHSMLDENINYLATIFSKKEETQFYADINNLVGGSPKIIERCSDVLKILKKKNSDLNSETDSYYQGELGSLRRSMYQENISSANIEKVFETIEDMDDKYSQNSKMIEFRNVVDFLEKYKNNLTVTEQIEKLKEVKKNLRKDVMTILKTKAGEENRFVYALAWIILLFQTFAVLFMYYKRVIAIIILIIIFPIVMAFYVFDKINDGQAQSLESWLREFLANIFVQVLHAAIYVIIINVGIEICNVNPSKNWFFLILAVCFIFPGERILRGILGLNSSTLGGLRVNIGTIAIAAHATYSLGKNTYRVGKNMVKGATHPTAVKNTMKDKIKKDREQQAKKDKETEELNKRKQEIYRKNREMRDRRIAANQAGIGTKLHHKIDKVGDKAKGITAKIKRPRPIKAIKGFMRTDAYRYGKMTMKAGFSGLKKMFGATAGLLEGMETFGESGISSAVSAGYSVAKHTGDFKSVKDVKYENNKKETPRVNNNDYVVNPMQAAKFDLNSMAPQTNAPDRPNESTINAARSATSTRGEIRTNINVDEK